MTKLAVKQLPVLYCSQYAFNDIAHFWSYSVSCIVFSAKCNIYISRLCHDASPSVCDGSALAHYSKFRFQILIPLYRALAAVLLAGAMLLAGESSHTMLASARLPCLFL